MVTHLVTGSAASATPVKQPRNGKTWAADRPAVACGRWSSTAMTGNMRADPVTVATLTL